MHRYYYKPCNFFIHRRSRTNTQSHGIMIQCCENMIPIITTKTTISSLFSTTYNINNATITRLLSSCRPTATTTTTTNETVVKHQMSLLRQNNISNQRPLTIDSLSSLRRLMSSSTTTTVINNSNSTINNENAEEWISKIQMILNDDDNNRLYDAQKLYDENYNKYNNQIDIMDSNDSTGIVVTTTKNLLREIQDSLFHSWIDYHNQCLSLLHQQQNNENINNNNNIVLSHNEYIRMVSNLCNATEFAHHILEHMIPSLSARNEFIINNNNNLQADLTMKKKWGSTKQQRQKKKDMIYDTKIRMIPSTSLQHQQQQPASSLTKENQEWTNKCNVVLLAWANTMKMIHHNSNSNSDNINIPSQLRSRVVPHRAQFLLERMETLYENAIYYKKLKNEQEENLLTIQTTKNDYDIDHNMNNNDTNIIVRPSLDSYINVIDTWGYSNEHLRGYQSEILYQRICNTFPNNDITDEVYRSMIRTWAYSTRDNRAAFTSTGHLINMLRQLAKQHQQYNNQHNNNNNNNNNNDDDDDDDDNTNQNNDHITMEPSLHDYKCIFKAWINSKDKNSPGKAYSLLKIIDSTYTNGYTTIQPDVECYQYILMTSSRKSIELPEMTSKIVDDVLIKMKNSYIIPNTVCYGSAIKTWKNVALFHYNNANNLIDVNNDNNETSSLSLCDNAIHRTYELFNEMKIAHHQCTYQSIYVTTEHINDVIEALSVSSNPHHKKYRDHAEMLLSEMEENMTQLQQQNTKIETNKQINYNDNNNNDNNDTTTTTECIPNADTYRFVINVWKSSIVTERISRAKAILWRFKDNYIPFHKASLSSSSSSSKRKRKDEKNNHYHDLVAVFNAYIEVCSTYNDSNNRSEQEGIILLKEALTAIEMMKTIEDLKPNSETYTFLLKACEQVLPIGEERQRIIETIFHLCCNDGLVDEGVLTQLRSIATLDQYHRMVVSVCHAEENKDHGNNKLVPEEWTINVLGGRVISGDGRRTKPLGIDGKLTITKAMQEFKMRRLRDKRNRILLQGGRLQHKNN